MDKCFETQEQKGKIQSYYQSLDYYLSFNTIELKFKISIEISDNFEEAECFRPSGLQNASDVKNICGCFFKCAQQQLGLVSCWEGTNLRRIILKLEIHFNLYCHLVIF